MAWTIEVGQHGSAGAQGIGMWQKYIWFNPEYIYVFWIHNILEKPTKSALWVSSAVLMLLYICCKDVCIYKRIAQYIVNMFESKMLPCLLQRGIDCLLDILSHVSRREALFWGFITNFWSFSSLHFQFQHQFQS